MAQLPSRTSVMVRSSKALHGSRSSTVLRDCRVVEAVSLHADRRQVIRSRAAAGSAKPPTRKRSETSALMASVWGKLWTPYSDREARRPSLHRARVCARLR